MMLRYFISILTILATLSCSHKLIKRNETLQLASKNTIPALWEHSLSKSLNLNLWEENFIYDAGHFLMIPMHYAFSEHYQLGIKEFEAHFTRFLINYKEDPKANDKARLHYYYLLSQYINLMQFNGIKNNNLPKIESFLEQQLEDYWNKREAWHWSSHKFKGMKERLIWKLDAPLETDEKKFYRFIFDDEKFMFAIAADLYSFKKHQNRPINNTIKEILDFGYTTFKRKIQFQKDGSWLMQPGVLSDHPDYQYAGYNVKSRHIAAQPVQNQSEDSSHSFRYALWLKSMNRAFVEIDSSKANYFLRLEKGLAQHFIKNILKKPTKDVPYYHLTNFMDGTNGLYCWKNTDSSQDFNGYGPNELSFSLVVGWWSFLESNQINKAYSQIDKNWEKAFVGASNTDQIFITKDLLALIVKVTPKVGSNNCFQKI
jgi:hypothetical protein